MAKTDSSPLTDAQREIMEIVWDRGEVSAFEIRQILNERRPVARNTVRTMLERIREKGWLKHRVIGRTYFYSAVVPREVGLGERVKEMVDKACGGKPERLMTALLEYRGLSDDEIRRIRAMLDKARSGEKGDTSGGKQS